MTLVRVTSSWAMPTTYTRDDRRRLIRIDVSDPYTIDEIMSLVDRRAREGTLEYAALYDFTQVAALPLPNDVRQLTQRGNELSASAAKQRGSIGVAIGPRPDLLRQGLDYSVMRASTVALELLITPNQIQDWLSRNAR